MDAEFHRGQRLSCAQDTRPPAGFSRYRTRAAALVRSPEALGRLTARAARKLAGSLAGGRLQEVGHELGLFVALLQAYLGGRYREVSTATLVSVAAAVLYFVVPLDLIPDFILGIGLLDDIAVITYVLERVRRELAAFERWQQAQDARARAVDAAAGEDQ